MLQKASIRALSLILAALMLLSLCACGAREPENPPATTVPLPEPMPDKEGPQEEPPQTPDAEDSKGDKIQDEKGVSEADPNAGGESAPSDKTGGGESAPPDKTGGGESAPPDRTGGGESAPPAAGDMQALQREVEQHTVILDAGDYVYRPPAEKLAVDPEAYAVYFDNLLIVYLRDPMTERQQEELAASVGGVVSGKLQNIGVLQIAVPDTDLDGLKACAETLMAVDGVVYATYSCPSAYDFTAEKTTNTPWTSPTNENNENDWWADAIDAWTAWEYSDQAGPVMVGIIDNGFDVEHEDFRKSNGQSVLEVMGNNTVNEHGTHVAGLIAAQNNGIGIRGIADGAQVLCASHLTLSDSIERNALIADMVFQAKNRNCSIVINCSFGASLLSPNGPDYNTIEYLKRLFFNNDELIKWLTTEDALEFVSVVNLEDYNDYLKLRNNQLQQDAAAAICTMLFLLDHGCDNFLVVQSAGNGYVFQPDGDYIGVGCQAEYTGLWAGVTEERFAEFMQLEGMREAYGKYSFQDIDEHLMIVASVGKLDSDGLYHLVPDSSYGDAVDICAPGEEICSTIPEDKDGMRYGQLSGTSMAAPLVTGSAALLWSLDPTLSAGKVKEYLKDPDRAVGVTGEDKGRLYPMLNVGRAVEKVVGLQYEEAASFSDAIRSCMQRIGYDSFSDTQKALCRGELFTFKGEEMLLLYYEVPAGTRVERSSYVDLWVKRDGQIRCLMNSRIENSEDRNLTLCNACIRIREGECMLHTYVRAVGGEDISQSCYYLIDDTFSLVYELYSKETAVYGQDGLLNPDESSGYYSVNMQETDRDSFYRLQDELNSGTNAVEMITLDPRSHEGIPPQGKTFEELLKQLQGDKDSAPGDGTARGDEDPIPGGGGIPDMEEIKEALLVHYAYPPERNRYAIFDFETVEKDQTIEFTLRRQSDGGDYYILQTLITVNKETGMASSLYHDEPWPVWDPATGKVYREIADFTVLSELHIPISEEDCYVILKNYFGLQMDPEKTRFDTSYVDPGNGDPYYYIEIFDPVFNGIGELYGPGVCDRWCIIYVNTGLAEEGAPTGAGSCTFDAVIYYY